MKPEYRALRLTQLSTAIDSFKGVKSTPRPSHGWLRAVRQALGISQQQVADAVGIKRPSLTDFEKSEATDRISIQNLRRIAEAMGCELVYAIVPKSGSIQELAESRARAEATKRVLSVRRTMALEDQTSGDVNELIDKETKRILKKP